MKWKDLRDILAQSHPIDLEDDVILYDQATGNEYDCDLIEFEDTGEISIVINGDED
jgi:hypothetical protein